MTKKSAPATRRRPTRARKKTPAPDYAAADRIAQEITIEIFIHFGRGLESARRALRDNPKLTGADVTKALQEDANVSYELMSSFEDFAPFFKSFLVQNERAQRKGTSSFLQYVGDRPGVLATAFRFGVNAVANAATSAGPGVIAVKHVKAALNTAKEECPANNRLAGPYCPA